ncbi:MAG: cold shock domain-containing protein [Nanoarchaeota archaeon]|nr:cold shock domain-containing protein [Nanoarchaeota archaeon]
MEGTVKWFNRIKGFGFIQGEDGNDYFAHYTQIPKGVFLKENDRVNFDAVETDKGKQAQNVTLLEGGAAHTKAPAEEAPAEEAAPEETSEEEPAEEPEEEKEE